jgi:hypothetical protein
LLLLSPFGVAVRRATQVTAEQRNLVAPALAERVFVVHAAPDSRTQALCRQVVAWGKPLLCLPAPANAHLIALGAQECKPAATSSRT